MTLIGTRGIGGSLALLLAFSLGTSACTTSRFETSANFDTEYDFPAVETFAFHGQREKASQTGNGQILEMTVRESLLAHGYREVPVEQADVFVHYDYGRYAPAKLSGSNSFAINRGTLTVSVIDPGTLRTVWYGWVETNMRKGDDGEVVIAEAVEALFEGHITNAKGQPKHAGKPAAKPEKPGPNEAAVDDVMNEAMGSGQGGGQ